MESTNLAVDLFAGGCACSQAVFGAFAEELGLDREQALKIAAGFASGMRMGEVCGAVTGALMALGMATCTETCNTMEGRAGVYAAARAFSEQFRQRNGSVICRELLGCDTSTPEGLKVAQENRLFQTRCVHLVGDAAEILEGMLRKAA